MQAFCVAHFCVLRSQHLYLLHHELKNIQLTRVLLLCTREEKKTRCKELKQILSNVLKYTHKVSYRWYFWQHNTDDKRENYRYIQIIDISTLSIYPDYQYIQATIYPVSIYPDYQYIQTINISSVYLTSLIKDCKYVFNSSRYIHFLS